ncbi:hypothetical protein SAMN05661008_00333 [Alkalithermobacter thermoalcaliphilus JW-YL-7 = DSM 7308]|uniref:Uncharacterized protein n=1 Tax=Alkalithermobacter thermoalcaliphilus JW-YL-7 = DSM 7308 TaxID=1121328 RepID=A0A150FPB9_CLOPD|nr:hypothetical protein JWYL7_0556 [[Clostridium] paradoxum JW-YL-7 = DSM 7308]SHK50078.1 hypothetical protein SAMN05661008_00333 [[Clostridium] paradoxum JW-YL-7 = DSM 7308]
MFNNFLRETAILKTKTGIDEYGKPSHMEKEIKCRIEEKIKVILSPSGEEVISTSRVFLDKDTQINIGDLIDNKKIITINTIKNYRGKIEGKEAFLQ